MKIVIGFKDPQALDNLDNVPDDIIKTMTEKYFQYGEYCYVEFDTETLEARVMTIDEE